jgi:dTDP-4-dehydrorhamnose 3,5-epimerase
MSSRFTIVPTPFSGLKILERKIVGDQRGSFHRMFCADELGDAGWTAPVAQINFTRTTLRGTIRGMHYQKAPFAEMKCVACVTGRVLDVVVDLRAGSATFLKWFSVELSEDNHRSVLVPEGFAHGFQALTDDVALLYSVSSPFTAAAEGGLNPLDPRIGIEWPLPVSTISARDAGQPYVTDAFRGMDLHAA